MNVEFRGRSRFIYVFTIRAASYAIVDIILSDLVIVIIMYLFLNNIFFESKYISVASINIFPIVGNGTFKKSKVFLNFSATCSDIEFILATRDTISLRSKINLSLLKCRANHDTCRLLYCP